MAIVAIVLSIDLARAICTIVQKMLDDSRQILVGVGKIIGGRMHVVTPYSYSLGQSKDQLSAGSRHQLKMSPTHAA